MPLPQQPYNYAYLYPPDALALRYLQPPNIPAAGSSIPQTSINNSVAPWVAGDTGAIPFSIAYTTDISGNPLEVVLTNQDQAIANYTVNQQNPQSWDSLFTSAFVASLASYLVPALALDKQLMQAQIQVTQRIIAEAKARDGNEGITSMDRVPDFLRARQGSGGRLWSENQYRASGTMPFPW